MNKYFNIFKFNLKTQLNFKLNYIFSLFSFAIHIFVFSSLWDYILKDKTILGYSKSELIWYVIIGELIIYTLTHNYKKISLMIKNGDIANMLTKPLNFTLYLLADEMTSIVKVLINIVFAITLGLFMAGTVFFSIPKLIIILISFVMSVFMIMLFEIIIGYIAFITEENEPFYFLLSKLMLIFVFTPMEFYDGIVQKILYFLPTTYIIYPTSKMFIHFDESQVIFFLSGQFISIILLFGIIKFLSWKGVKNINVNGG
jgi:ABC-2 type transport system permease protein